MIFCKKCLYTGTPKWRTIGRLNEGDKEVCPNCNTAKHIDVYLDAASAEHAKSNHQQTKSKKSK